MDVAAWSECVGLVAEKLVRFDPAHAEEYRQNATGYRAELQRLDQYVRTAIASIPEQQRVLVTAHDAFHYFSRAYEIPVRSIQGISTESEAGVNDINRLVDFLAERKIKAIFVETSVSEKNIRAVVEGTAQKGWNVAIGGALFSDAMGRAGTYEGTYIGMIDHNATTIARALGGDAPEKGLLGKLSVCSGTSWSVSR
jgi:manganese/zinc/iron transport system substrate-binding protein